MHQQKKLNKIHKWDPYILACSDIIHSHSCCLVIFLYYSKVLQTLHSYCINYSRLRSEGQEWVCLHWTVAHQLFVMFWCKRGQFVFHEPDVLLHWRRPAHRCLSLWVFWFGCFQQPFTIIQQVAVRCVVQGHFDVMDQRSKIKEQEERQDAWSWMCCSPNKMNRFKTDLVCCRIIVLNLSLLKPELTEKSSEFIHELLSNRSIKLESNEVNRLKCAYHLSIFFSLRAFRLLALI